jgi:hypothetical protein
MWCREEGDEIILDSDVEEELQLLSQSGQQEGLHQSSPKNVVYSVYKCGHSPCEMPSLLR